jgi:hypothetical protein
MGNFGHPRLHVHQDNGIARCGFAVGLVGYSAGDGCGLGHRARKKKAESKSAKNYLGRFHFVSNSFNRKKTECLNDV